MQNVIIKIGLVDDHLVFKKALRIILSSYSNIQVVLDANNGSDLLEKLKIAEVDILLLDLTMPVMGGLEVMPVLKQIYPGIKVIVLSLHDDELRVSKAIQNGAFSYLLKNDSPSHMVKQIEICNGMRSSHSNK